MTEVQQLALGFYRSGMPLSEYCILQEYAYPHIIQHGLLEEGIRDLAVDLVQTGLGAGAIVLTGGMGGDTAVDVLFAVDSANDVKSAIASLSQQGSVIIDVLSDIASMDTSQGLDSIYSTVQFSVDKVIAGLDSGPQITQFLDDARDTIMELLNSIIKSVGKWIATLIPDDAGLAGPAVRESVMQAIKRGANYPYAALSESVGSLPSFAQDVLFDPDALESFLIGTIDEIVAYIDERKSGDQGFISKATDYIPVVGAAKALAKGEYKTAAMRAASDIAIPLKYTMALSQETPIIRNFLEGTVRDNVPIAVEAFNKIVALLFGGVALLQVVMQGDFEGSRAKAMASAGEEAKELLGQVASDITQKIAAESRYLLESTSQEFAATAEEEAKKINQQSGVNIVTDQEHWSELDVHTGEDLARSLMISNYSDTYKSIHGIRPRWVSFEDMSFDDIQEMVEDLYEDEDMATHGLKFGEDWDNTEDEYREWHREHETQRDTAVAEEEEMMQTPESEYELTPTRQTARRLGESRTAITRRQLRQLIRNTIIESLK